MNDQAPMPRCTIPQPKGFTCTRWQHEGPCACAMVKGTRVSFSWKRFPSVDASSLTHGTGTVITDEDDTGHVLVAQDPAIEGAPHPVIWCTVSWLTVI